MKNATCPRPFFYLVLSVPESFTPLFASAYSPTSSDFGFCNWCLVYASHDGIYFLAITGTGKTGDDRGYQRQYRARRHCSVPKSILETYRVLGEKKKKKTMKRL